MSESSRRRPSGLRVAVAQIAPVLGDVQANLAKHKEAVTRALDEKAQLLVFPELSLTGYHLKDSVPDVALGPTSEVVAELAAMSKDLALLVGLVQETKDHYFYNAAAYFEKGDFRAAHRKVYLPTYGMFDEQRYFARGRRIIPFDAEIGRVGTLICEDMLHPTAPVVAALDGASILLVPSASPARGITDDSEEEADGGDWAHRTDQELKRREKLAAQREEEALNSEEPAPVVIPSTVDANGRQWERYNRTIARSLGVYVVYANRVGVEDGVVFWGGSEVIAPNGQCTAKAAYYEEDLIIGAISDDAVRRARIENPMLRDEDMDLTINELSRIRGRRDAERRTAAREADSRGDRGGGYRGEDRRGGGGPPPRRDDRGGGYRGGGGPPRDDRGGGYRGGGGPPPRRDDRGGGGYRGGDAPRRDDRGGGGYRGGDAPRRDDRGGGGYRGGDAPRRDDRGGGGYRGGDAPRRDDRGGGGYRGGDAPRRDDRGGGGYRGGDAPRRDDRGGGGYRGGDGPRRDGRDAPERRGRTPAEPFNPPRVRERPEPKSRKPRPLELDEGVEPVKSKSEATKPAASKSKPVKATSDE